SPRVVVNDHRDLGKGMDATTPSVTSSSRRSAQLAGPHDPLPVLPQGHLPARAVQTGRAADARYQAHAEVNPSSPACATCTPPRRMPPGGALRRPSVWAGAFGGGVDADGSSGV